MIPFSNKQFIKGNEMLKRKNRKLLATVATVTMLVGCQSTETADYADIRSVSNISPTPTGQKLGGGFVAGMSPEQTCIYFLDHYNTKKNQLCRNVGKKDFSNLTLVNYRITNTPENLQGIDTMAFFFDQNKNLSKVMAVADPSHDSLGKEEYKNKLEKAVPIYFY